ncbi:phosphatase PAP2 family protein [Streptomyces sp. WI04-05B]|uniref:phosphatase PAP2 family protein n=1 Tax=Streptomyces TaxID=1883 RepID=UPI0029AD29DA|nr:MULTISPECIES: phosphatase PAP2 family protein [unclassified Streptomyces]MDX2545718.1 phosphatase PAP2 family protein [Streptomyces sp. WI04-05B]MDX2583449.1 phosphatase PAP2 family protein [Streptomyces sp. WI04-05A]MDX3745217.1 phosphatase PAP2 family protein [Streptomyces sp. AK08-02]
MRTPHLVPRLQRPVRHRAVHASVALALASALLLTLVAADWHPLITLDGDIARATHRWAVDEPGLTHAFRILTDWVWDPLTMRLLCAAVAVWLVWRHSAWGLALWLAVVCALGTVLQQALKAAVGRARPVWPDPVDSAHYAAFPSGHAMTATVVCGLLLWLLHRYGAGRVVWRTAVTGSVISVLGAGLTRIWLGVHWPSDVLGGWLLGALVVSLAVLAHERFEPAPERP